jgi:hypothetical protein
MSHEPSSDRKRKAVEEPEVAISSEDQSPKKSKAPKVTLDSSMTLSRIASLQGNAQMATERVATVNSMGRIEKKIQNLSGSDNVEVNAALVALLKDLAKDPKTYDNIFSAGGSHALVRLLKSCLEKAIAVIPACDQVTEAHELAELKTIHRTLRVIVNLTFQREESRVEIAEIGGVEVVVKIMKTFPKSEKLQRRACQALRNLTCCSIVQVKAVESGGIEVLLAAINNHLGSASLCENACFSLCNIGFGSKENIDLMISLGGGAAFFKIKAKWPDIDFVHKGVLRYLAAQMTVSQPAVSSSSKSSDDANNRKRKPTKIQETVSSNDGQNPNEVNKKARTVSTNALVIPAASLQVDTPVATEKAAAANTASAITEDVRHMQQRLLLLRHSAKCQHEDGCPATPHCTSMKRLWKHICKCKNQKCLVPHCVSSRHVLSHNYRCKDVGCTVCGPLREAIHRSYEREMQMQALKQRHQQAVQQVATATDSNADAVSAVSASNTEHEESTSNEEPEDQIRSIGTLIQDLLSSDYITSDAALHTLRVDLVEDSTKWDHVVAVGGCFAVVSIMWLVVNEMTRWIPNESI